MVSVVSGRPPVMAPVLVKITGAPTYGPGMNA